MRPAKLKFEAIYDGSENFLCWKVLKRQGKKIAPVSIGAFANRDVAESFAILANKSAFKFWEEEKAMESKPGVLKKRGPYKKRVARINKTVKPPVNSKRGRKAKTLPDYTFELISTSSKTKRRPYGKRGPYKRKTG